MSELRDIDETENEEGLGVNDATPPPQGLGALADHARKKDQKSEQDTDTTADDNIDNRVRSIQDPKSNYQFEGPALQATHAESNPDWTEKLNTENGAEIALEKCATQETPLGSTDEQFARAKEGFLKIGHTANENGIDVDIRFRGSGAEGFSGNPTKDANPENIADTWLTKDFPKDLVTFEGLALSPKEMKAVLEPARDDVVAHIAEQFETFRDDNGQLPVGRPFDSESHVSKEVGDVILDNPEVQQKLEEYVERDPGLAGRLRDKFGLDSSASSSDLAGRLSDQLRENDPFERPPSDVDVQVSSNQPFEQRMAAVLENEDLSLSELEVLKDKFGIFREALEVLNDENSDDDARRTAWYSIDDANKSLIEPRLEASSPFNEYGGLNKELPGKIGSANPLIVDIRAQCKELQEEIGRDVKPMFFPDGGPPPYNFCENKRDEENVSMNKQGDWKIYTKEGQQ